MNKKWKQWGGAGIVLLALVLIVIIGVGKGAKTDGRADTEAAAVQETETQIVYQPVEPKELNKELYLDTDKPIEERVAELLSQMALEEKIAQMIQPEQSAISYEEIAKYDVGSVLSGGGSAPASGNTAEDWQQHIDNIKRAAAGSRLGIPVLYGVDAVHGHNNVYGAVIYPHNIGLGAANDAELMEKIGTAVAEEVRATGIQWTFAPTLANPQNELWGRTYEGFGEDVDIVAELGTAFIKGAQGEKDSAAYLDDAHVLATAKHYIGEGYTMNGTNQGNVNMDEDEFEQLLREQLLLPYQDAIDAGVRTVMVSFSSINGVKTHEDKYLITDVLKGDLGFTGLVVSDYNGVQQVTGKTYKDKIENGVNAGIDLFMEPNDWKEFMQALKELVEESRVSMNRIDDAVSRILRVKFEAGLFEEEIGGEMEQELLAKFGGEEHRAIAREAVSRSMVLLKNDKTGDRTALEALAGAKNITVAGRKADDIGAQCGGWTISWQGSTGDITEGTTILEGLQQAAGDGVNVNYSEAGEIGADTDAIVLVIGETPYAESSGDRSVSNLILPSEDRKLLEMVQENRKAAGKEDVPLIVLLLSGRMLSISEQLADIDGLVMLWLPGSEGEGVADVLLGEQDFTGTLQYTWTWSPSDIAKKFTVDEDKILFAKGTGLKKDGSSILSEGTTVIGNGGADASSDSKITGVDLASANYVIEAENYEDGSTALQQGNANNIVFVHNWCEADAQAKWSVYVPEAGNYRLHFKIAADSDISGVSASCTLDGKTQNAELSIQKTKNMNEYQNCDMDVVLEKGSYTVQLDAKTGSGDFRLDCIEFEYLD